MFYPMTNRELVSLNWNLMTLVPSPTNCELHFTSSEFKPHESWHPVLWTGEWNCAFCFGSCMSSYPMTKSQNQVCDTVHSAKWQCHDHCVIELIYRVRHISYFLNWSLTISIWWLIACEWHCTFCWMTVLQHLYHDPQKASYISHFLSPHHFLWMPIGCECHCIFS